MKHTNPVAADLAGGARFPFTLPGVVLIVAIYALVHATTRLLASGNLGEDDTLDNLLIQTLSPGYSTHTGPLYDWLLWLLQQAFGTGLAPFLALKYTLLVVMAGGLFLITRRLSGSALWAFIAVESMATVYQIFWRFHEGFTHRVGAMALVIATLLLFLRLLDNGNWRHYLAFGVLAGLGLLSEHTYAFFLIALLAAASLQPDLRRRTWRAPILASLPPVVLITAPYVLWLLAEPSRLSALVAEYYPPTPVHSWAALWASLRDAITFPLLVLAPYSVIVPLVFPALFKSIFKPPARRPGPAVPADLSRLLTHLLLIEFCGLIVGNLLYARAGYAVHSILPIFVVAIVWLTEKARQTNPEPRRIKLFMLILLAFTMTAYAMRWSNLFIEEPFCSRCRWGIPYNDLADNLRRLGFSDGTLVSNDERMSGNLRRFFPQARFILSTGAPIMTAERSQQGGKLAAVWSVSSEHETMPGDLQHYLGSGAAALQPVVIRSPWQHLWRPTGYRNSSWAVVVTEWPVSAKP
ncbi:MAG: hypothetical protein H6R15_4157 [Proteobacteria bacterium]|nr:hypothetical protein [Pseudomonadota bacterium]